MEKLNDSNVVSGPVSRTVDRAAESVHQSINAATEKSHPAIDRIASGAHNATDSIGEVSSNAAGAIDKKSEQLMDAEAHLVESVRTFVQEKPLSALGIAAGTGFALNWLVKKRQE